MTNFKPGIEYAKEQDLLDPLAHFRTKFHIPKNSHGEEWLYFTGNSLGLQPKETKNYIQQELDDWAKLGVEGHFEAKNPWMPYHEFLTETMAEIVGAKPIEVVIMNTLTTNLHLLMISFYQPTILKHKILIESDAFPSDRYAVETQLRFHGFDPTESLIEWSPRKGETLLNIEDLESILQSNGNEIALLLIGGVNYYTGLIYKDKFKEYTLSQNKLEQLLKQFPEDRLVLPTKYNLYKVYSLLGLSQSQAILKKDIIENHKDSRYAAILLNPELALLNNENSPQSLYNNLYTQFELGNYQEVIDGCDLQITRLDGDEIVPKLELLKATSRARLYGFEAYKEGLNFVALNYPSSLEGKKAAQMYSTIIPELANKAFVEDSTQTNFKVVFKFDRSEVEEINTFETALSTAVEEVDYFNLTVSRDGYNTNTIFVVVHGLKSVQGALGFVKILETENELIISKPYFGISSMNYQIVQIHKNAERYIKSIK